MPSNSINQLLINIHTTESNKKTKKPAKDSVNLSLSLSLSLSLTSRSDSFDLMIRVKDPFYGMESLFLFYFLYIETINREETILLEGGYKNKIQHHQL
jgi:hypothetical protein